MPLTSLLLKLKRVKCFLFFNRVIFNGVLMYEIGSNGQNYRIKPYRC